MKDIPSLQTLQLNDNYTYRYPLIFRCTCLLTVIPIQRSVAEVSRGHIVMIPDPLPKLSIILRRHLSLPNHSIVLMLGTGLVIRTVSPLYMIRKSCRDILPS
jgi:hypothetical protein